MEQITQEQMNKIDEAIKALPDQLTKSGVLGSVIAVADSYSTNPIDLVFTLIEAAGLVILTNELDENLASDALIGFCEAFRDTDAEIKISKMN